MSLPCRGRTGRMPILKMARWTLLAALGRGRQTKRADHSRLIFYQITALITALEPRRACAGVRVDIILPDGKNKPCRPVALGVTPRAVWWQVLERGLPHLAHGRRPLRPLQTDGGGWPLGPARLGETGMRAASA